MAHVRLERKVDIPVGLAFSTLGEILQAIAAQERGWKEFALHADLGDFGLPDVGYIAVPIALTVGAITPGLNQYKITISAARHPEAFPTFNGALGADMAGTSESTMWLNGDYAIPFGTLGTLINIGMANKAAERSLENFLSDITKAAKARVDKREADFIRYALFQHGG